MLTATIFDIQRSSYVDGPGIRTTVFFKGCNLRCNWCHNPESQSRLPQMMFYKNKCTDCGKCKEKCPNALEKCDLCGKCALYCPHDAREICGREYTVEEVLEEVLKDKDYYGENGGITFSGGECMLQIDFLEKILKACKEKGLQTAVDTAGNVPYQYFERISPIVDLYLYDVKCYSEKLHREGTGVSNKLILKNLAELSKNFKDRIIIRIPIIPGFNADEKELKLIRNYLSELGIKAIELLPYHKMGEHKWQAIGLKSIPRGDLGTGEMEKFKKIFNI